MTVADLLPFERAFREWVETHGMGWERFDLPVPPDGTTTAYRFTPRDRPLKRVLALHGAGNDALFAWVGLFKQLLLRDVEVFTFDLPGHGRFGRGAFDRDAAVAACRSAIACCQDGPTIPVHAIGVSLGGSVLLGTLPDLQKQFAGAALLAAPLQIHLSLRNVLPEIGPRTFSAVWREREHYGLTGLIPSFGPFRRDIYPLRLRETVDGAFGYVRTLNRILSEMHLEECARRVEIPVLLVYGSRDRIVPPEQGKRLCELLSRGCLETVNGTHLSTPLEPRTVARLLDWLDPLE